MMSDETVNSQGVCKIGTWIFASCKDVLRCNTIGRSPSTPRAFEDKATSREAVDLRSFHSECAFFNPSLDNFYSKSTVPTRATALLKTMATDAALQDPLLSLRRAIASGNLPTPTTSSELSDQPAADDLAKATHLYFAQPVPQTIALSTPTRFISASTKSPVDLRSILFAWQNKDVAIPEYIAKAQDFNEALKKQTAEGGKEESVQILIFLERLDLFTWLEGASDDSEHIKPLEGAAAAAEAAAAAAGVAQADDAAGIAAGASGGVAAVPSGAAGPAQAGAQAGRPQKQIDPRLQEIYNGERKIGDRNTVLRGIKPTVSQPGPGLHCALAS